MIGYELMKYSYWFGVAYSPEAAGPWAGTGRPNRKALAAMSADRAHAQVFADGVLAVGGRIDITSRG
jgi:hypothetical protein